MHPLSVSCLFESCHAAYCLCDCVSTWVVVIVLYLFRLFRTFSVPVRFAGLRWAGAAEVRLQPSGVQRDFLFQGWRRALPARLGRLQALMIGPVIGGCPNTVVALACASPVVLDRFLQCGPVFLARAVFKTWRVFCGIMWLVISRRSCSWLFACRGRNMTVHVRWAQRGHGLFRRMLEWPGLLFVVCGVCACHD